VIEDEKRVVIPKSQEEIETYTSTAAIEGILCKEQNIKDVKSLIFVQDTILIDDIIRNWSEYDNEQFSRNILKRKLYKYLYDSNPDVAREFNVNSHEKYKDIAIFIPGVITCVNGGKLYTWRGEHIYDIAKGIIVLEVYEKLKNLGGCRIAIIVDTTHGINYLPILLKEATLVAAELFALENILSIDELTVYHYNSDPLHRRIEGKPSLKIHLLDELHIARNGELYIPRLTSLLMEVEDRRHLLETFWSEIDWRELLDASIFYSRGLFVWALRVAANKLNIIGVDQLKKSAEDIKVTFERNENRFKINYKWEGKLPVIYVTLLSIFYKIMQKYAFDMIEKQLNSMETLIDQILNMLKGKSCLLKLLEIINESKGKKKFVYFKLDEVIRYAKKLLTEPFKEINIHELQDNLVEYLEGNKKLGWRKVLCDSNLEVYASPGDRYIAYFISSDEISVIASLETHVDRRNIYAHAGLPYGLKWLAINLKQERKKLLCLGNIEHIRNMIITE
jgi:CRISPR-associated protein Csx1